MMDMALGHLGQWTDLASAAGLRPLLKLVDLLEAHREGILDCARYSIHTCRLEGINGRIRSLERQDYRYNDEDYFTLCTKEALPGKHQRTQSPVEYADAS